MNTIVTVNAHIEASIEKVWECFTDPSHITKWAFASPDWEAPRAENDLRVGGKFVTVMAAKDKSESFDFSGTYTAVENQRLIAYTMDDNRTVEIEFHETETGVDLVQKFEIEGENSEELQRSGWQAIVDNFKKYVEQSS